MPRRPVWIIIKKTPAPRCARRPHHPKKEGPYMLRPETTEAYLSILREELVPATGCTEPIALAYAAARLRALLGAAPARIEAEISGNIIKNVKSVVVPNTGGRKGIAAAIAAAVAGASPPDASAC